MLDNEEQQQVEQIKKWFSENGLFLAISLVVAIIALFAYQYWNQITEKDTAQASEQYELLLDDLANNKIANAQEVGSAILTQHKNSTYASLAALLMANEAVQEKHYELAQSYLQKVIKEGHVAALREIARLRLARLQIENGKPEVALNLLNDIDEKQYIPAVDAIRGDAYVALKKYDLAKGSYQQALIKLPDDAIFHTLVAMKLNDLPN